MIARGSVKTVRMHDEGDIFTKSYESMRLTSMYEPLDCVNGRWFDISIIIAHKGQHDSAPSRGLIWSGCISKVALCSPSQRRKTCSASNSVRREMNVGLTKTLITDILDNSQKQTMMNHVKMRTTTIELLDRTSQICCTYIPHPTPNPLTPLNRNLAP